MDVVLEVYADAFVRCTPVPPRSVALLERLSRRYLLALVSNWPLALAVERFLETAGWLEHLSVVVISHRVGTIKPHPAIFEVAARELGVPSRRAIIHVGDDLGADVVGARGPGLADRLGPDQTRGFDAARRPAGAGRAPGHPIDTVLDLEEALGLCGRHSRGGR